MALVSAEDLKWVAENWTDFTAGEFDAAPLWAFGEAGTQPDGIT